MRLCQYVRQLGHDSVVVRSAAMRQRLRAQVADGTLEASSTRRSHGNTAKAAENTQAADLARTLSEKGHGQCAAARAAWFHKYRDTVVGKYAIVSSAQRTGQTLQAIFGEDAAAISLEIGGQIYFDTPGRSSLEKSVWDSLTYSPLQTYWDGQ